MTDRAQPGAIDSIVRNYELGDALGQFSDGWVVPADEPTASAQRSDLDETAFTAFDETSSSSSLTVTIGAGEAFVDGWVATDASTDVELAASTSGQTVGVSWDPDAAFDPNSDADQDDADRVVVALESDVSALDPFLPLWTFETDGSGATNATDERQIGPTVGPAALRDRSGNVIENLVGENLTLADGELQGSVGIDVRRAVNDLFIQSARQDFELGLNMLDYRDGQFEVFANDERIRSSNAVELQLGSPLDDLGFVELGTVLSLSAGSFTEKAEFTGHASSVLSVFVTDSHGYSGSFDNTVKQWDPDTMEATDNEFTGHGSTVQSVFVTDSHGYSAGSDVVRQWDPDTMEATDNEFTAHTDVVLSVFVTDTHGYSGGDDDTVKQWDPDTMEATDNEFTGHTDSVRSVFATDDRGYSGSFDDTVKQWTGESPALSGDVSHTFEDLDFVPDEAVINDNLREPLADGATVFYEIEDADGNSQTIPRSEVDTTVDLTDFTSSEVSTTAIIEREDDTVESPELDAWALYLRDE